MSNIFTKASRLLVLAALLLSGCFRPAGDSIQPTSGFPTETPIPQLSDATATPGAPAITLLSPDTSGASPTAPAFAITEVTVMPFEATTTPTPVEGPVTATLQIITPGVALDLVTPETPTPLPTEPPTPVGTVPTEVPTIDTETLVRGAPCTYTVQPGDSLYRIAILNDTNVVAMREANPQLTGDPPILQPGQVLRLPDCTPGVEPTTDAEQVIAPIGDTPVPPGGELYTVQPGDTLYAIAIRYRTTVNAILEANQLANPNSLSIGQELIIPGQGSSNQ